MINRLEYLLLWLVALLAVAITSIWALVAGLYDPKSSISKKVLIAFDQAANAVTGGSEDDTISSRAYVNCLKKVKWACLLCKFLDIFEKNHCKKSFGT